MTTAQLNAVRQIADKMEDDGITLYATARLAHAETVALGGFVYYCQNGKFAAVAARSIHKAESRGWQLAGDTWSM